MMDEFDTRVCLEENVKSTAGTLGIAGCRPAHGVTVGHTSTHIFFVLRDESNAPFAYTGFEPAALKAMLDADSLWREQDYR